VTDLPNPFQIIRDQIALDYATLGYLQPITAAAEAMMSAVARALVDVERAERVAKDAVRAGDVRAP
jgi:hypothetical protein